MNYGKFADRFTIKFIRTLVNLGYIDLSGKNGEEIIREVTEFLDALDEVNIVLDHTPNLLRQARAFRRSNNELACLFYALWIEHKLNSMIHTLASRKGFHEKEVERLLRESSCRAKCSWILRLFDIKSIHASHMNAINKLMELRNSFVHYKWKPQNDQTSKEVQLVLNSIEKTVRYLHYFERKHLAIMSTRKVQKALRRKSRPSGVRRD